MPQQRNKTSNFKYRKSRNRFNRNTALTTNVVAMNSLQQSLDRSSIGSDNKSIPINAFRYPSMASSFGSMAQIKQN